MNAPDAHGHSCRFCGSQLQNIFADLGSTPLANRNLAPDEIATERSYPLIARVCHVCLLVQIDDAVPADEIFSDYDYFSSYSSMWVEHGRLYCNDMVDRFRLDERSQVVEIASNDGYLLQHFKAAGIRVLGVDPAKNVAAVAVAKGIPTEVAFFGTQTARDMVERGFSADLMAANNVLAHVPDIRDFVNGFAVLLKPEGVATFEFPHIMRQIEGVQFDTIYHEHYYYLSLLTTERVLASAGLRVFDVAELPTHGGSLRLFVCKEAASHQQTDRVVQMRLKEKEWKLDTLAGYMTFASKIAAVKKSFLAFLDETKKAGKSVAAYGAAAKGNTFLNVCGVTNADIGAVYDLSTAKQGKLTPGSHIEIRPPARMEVDRPDFVVILPWNLVGEICASMKILKSWNGQFVVAVPETRIV
jgi:2-polyprenyl-3-methyl-5-hydroxy-6-metoxy-1,4-benzoquinol methylase